MIPTAEVILLHARTLTTMERPSLDISPTSELCEHDMLSPWTPTIMCAKYYNQCTLMLGMKTKSIQKSYLSVVERCCRMMNSKRVIPMHRKHTQERSEGISATSSIQTYLLSEQTGCCALRSTIVRSRNFCRD